MEGITAVFAFHLGISALQLESSVTPIAEYTEPPLPYNIALISKFRNISYDVSAKFTPLCLPHISLSFGLSSLCPVHAIIVAAREQFF